MSQLFYLKGVNQDEHSLMVDLMGNAPTMVCLQGSPPSLRRAQRDDKGRRDVLRALTRELDDDKSPPLDSNQALDLPRM